MQQMRADDARPGSTARAGRAARSRQRIDRSRPGLRRPARALGRQINEMSHLPKWLLLATVIGVIAGLGAVFFYETLSLGTHLFLRD